MIMGHDQGYEWSRRTSLPKGVAAINAFLIQPFTPRRAFAVIEASLPGRNNIGGRNSTHVLVMTYIYSRHCRYFFMVMISLHRLVIFRGFHRNNFYICFTCFSYATSNLKALRGHMCDTCTGTDWTILHVLKFPHGCSTLIRVYTCRLTIEYCSQ